MKNLLIGLIFCLICLPVIAQQDRFIYLQTENKDPFFVKLNNKVFNSSPAGYLIIPKLDDGLHSLIIGFAQSSVEQEFNCTINQKDVGFIIKNTGEQWQLVNIQTLNVIVPGGVITKPVTVYQKESDSFSTMLANAVQDSTLLQKDIVQETSPLVQDSLAVQKEVENADTIQSVNSNNDAAIVRSTIKRKLKKNNKEGMEMIYIDDNGETKDTIRILIPPDKPVKKDEVIKTTDPIVVTPEKNDKPKDDSDKAEYIVTEDEKKIIKEANESVQRSSMSNSDCKNIATEEDFLKLRKKMVAESNDEDMIKAAQKLFKTRCFTTDHIKNLSVLFLKDESKYMFFDAAYPFVSDTDLYYTLEKQLTDTYYISRFRALINK